MEPLRLDPADPFASVLAWLAALGRALGLDPALRASRVPPTREVAAAVRVVLADWSRQLRALIRAEAGRLARRLMASEGCGSSRPPSGFALLSHLPRTRGRKETPTLRALCSPAGGGAVERSETEGGRAGRRRSKLPPDSPLDPEQAAALKRRTRAVLLALHDPSAMIRRLALRLVRVGAAPAHETLPRPPRLLGVPPRGLARDPEPRPPDRRRVRPPTCSTPRGFPAAPSALADRRRQCITSHQPFRQFTLSVSLRPRSSINSKLFR